jgi:formate hydrogenlyase subunit 3/multisubunit Na+/H+ antiporter MnhD subunit
MNDILSIIIYFGLLYIILRFIIKDKRKLKKYFLIASLILTIILFSYVLYTRYVVFKGKDQISILINK